MQDAADSEDKQEELEVEARPPAAASVAEDSGGRTEMGRGAEMWREEPPHVAEGGEDSGGVVVSAGMSCAGRRNGIRMKQSRPKKGGLNWDFF